MIRFYLVPIVLVGEPPLGPARGPKYVYELSVDWGMMDYGLIDAGLVAASVTQAQHELLVVEPDVATTPEDIDQNISDIAIPKVVAVMEQLRIPAGWIDNTYTYREILRMLAGLFQLAQRHNGLHSEEIIENQSQLELRWNQIPQAKRQRLRETADSFGYDYSEITNAWTVRRILKYLGDQWGDQVFHMGVVDL